MAVHSLHIFDRKGKTLFTKRYAPGGDNDDKHQLSEQLKLVFGMLFSLRETCTSLAPETEIKDAGLHSVSTGAGTLHNYETLSGLRFALYTTSSSSSSRSGGNNNNNNGKQQGAAIRTSLRFIYTNLWVEYVIRSPIFNNSKTMDVSSTNFEQKLDAYLKSKTWFK
mmetsp:Transcript_38349/g.42416  ORF Transcript_38349/g.42416 Transcript_38349/m.42416 type:complete len:166 (+) Transcript_38349:182-679(+)